MMTIIKTDEARGGIASRNHAVLKVLVISLGLAIVIGLGITVFA